MLSSSLKKKHGVVNRGLTWTRINTRFPCENKEVVENMEMLNDTLSLGIFWLEGEVSKIFRHDFVVFSSIRGMVKWGEAGA